MNFNTNVFDIAKSICLVIMVAAVIFFGYKLVNKPNQLMVDRLEMERIAENIVKKQIVVDTKELKEAIKELAESNGKLLSIIKDRDEDIREVGTIVAKVKQRVDKMSEPSDHTYSKGGINDHEFVKIYGKDSEGKEYPVAWAMYHPNQTEDKRWKTGTYPQELNLAVVETESKKGDYNKYVDAWIENNQMKSTKGNQYPIEVASVEWYREKVKEKGFDFNLRLGATGAMGHEDLFPGIDMSLFSYGRTHRDIDWRFIVIGIGGTSDRIYGYFVPVQYNAGNFLPLIENLQFGPLFGISDDATKNYGVAFSVLF